MDENIVQAMIAGFTHGVKEKCGEVTPREEMLIEAAVRSTVDTIEGFMGKETH